MTIVSVTVNVLLPLFTSVPPGATKPENDPLWVRMSQTPPVIAAVSPAFTGSGSWVIAAQNTPVVGVTFTTPVKLPAKIAAPQMDCGHNSIPETVPAMTGFET